MRNFKSTMGGMLAASALFLAATPAFAGDEEQALAAIAQAQGKIDAANKLKGSTVSPELLARAQAALRLAQEELKSGKEQRAIKSALDAQQFADTAIGESQQRADADAQVQASTVAGAQQDAAAANARADVAEQAAASSAADAQAARNAAAVAAATPATTTVTTETVKAATPTATRSTTAPKRKIVRKTTTAPARAAQTERTTTTVTTQK